MAARKHKRHKKGSGSVPFAPFRGHCSSWPGTRRVFRIGHSYQDDGKPSTVTSYDGRGYRIRKVIAGGDTFDYYQNEQNQTIEVRRNGDADAYEQYVYDQRYVDAPVLVYRDTDTDGASIQSLYVAQDANFNVTAILDGATGAVLNRFVYTPYGQRTVLDGSWQSSTSDFLLGHQGLYLDEESGLYYNRARYYHPTLGRFLQRDPLGYVDGAHAYQYVRGNPLLLLDAMGLAGGAVVPMASGGGAVVPLGGGAMLPIGGFGSPGTTVVSGSGPWGARLPYWDMGSGIVFIPPTAMPTVTPGTPCTKFVPRYKAEGFSGPWACFEFYANRNPSPAVWLGTWGSGIVGLPLAAGAKWGGKLAPACEGLGWVWGAWEFGLAAGSTIHCFEPVPVDGVWTIDAAGCAVCK